ncbi:hypothetical protein HUN41_00177 [Streptomyces phage Coruscant]|uniref:Uncharacterized protein n=1 Tax=Streptomyces phage Coruscant TaxID=2739834 RepID=A0A7G4AW86_9CAUD|nr:hypothetical protein PP454_gp141 [Streptomyces phage Coruscant]QMP84276.1 hypothetical protein HUN41_00177 [Streptomyces phage Coruscant]
MSSSFEEDIKSLAVRWSECGGSHSDDLLEEIFGSLVDHFPGWTPESKDAQHYINYVKK